MSDPIELVQMRQMIADARQGFAADVDALLEQMRTHSDALALAIGEVSPQEALVELRKIVLQKFDQRLTLKHPDVELLRALVREAFDLLQNPETTIDLRDWIRAAEPFIREG